MAFDMDAYHKACNESSLARELDKGEWEIGKAIEILMRYTPQYQDCPYERITTFMTTVDLKTGEVTKNWENDLDIQDEDRKMIIKLFMSHYPGRQLISPYNFIAWAIERDTIYVGRQLVNWKRRKDIARQFPQEGEAAQWQAILPELDAGKSKAAQAAICKLKGMSHAETYRQLFEGVASPESMANRISGLHKKAQAIANEYSLKMPAWNIRKS